MRALRAAMLICALSLPLVSALTVAAAASEHGKRGAEIGAAIPHSLSAVDQSGGHQEFKSLARRRGLIILFSRSYDW